MLAGHQEQQDGSSIQQQIVALVLDSAALGVLAKSLCTVSDASHAAGGRVTIIVTNADRNTRQSNESAVVVSVARAIAAMFLTPQIQPCPRGQTASRTQSQPQLPPQAPAKSQAQRSANTAIGMTTTMSSAIGDEGLAMRAAARTPAVSVTSPSVATAAASVPVMALAAGSRTAAIAAEAEADAAMMPSPSTTNDSTTSVCGSNFSTEAVKPLRTAEAIQAPKVDGKPPRFDASELKPPTATYSTITDIGSDINANGAAKNTSGISSSVSAISGVSSDSSESPSCVSGVSLAVDEAEAIGTRAAHGHLAAAALAAAATPIIAAVTAAHGHPSARGSLLSNAAVHNHFIEAAGGRLSQEDELFSTPQSTATEPARVPALVGAGDTAHMNTDAGEVQTPVGAANGAMGDVVSPVVCAGAGVDLNHHVVLNGGPTSHISNISNAADANRADNVVGAHTSPAHSQSSVAHSHDHSHAYSVTSAQTQAPAHGHRVAAHTHSVAAVTADAGGGAHSPSAAHSHSVLHSLSEYHGMSPVATAAAAHGHSAATVRDHSADPYVPSAAAAAHGHPGTAHSHTGAAHGRFAAAPFGKSATPFSPPPVASSAAAAAASGIAGTAATVAVTPPQRIRTGVGATSCLCVCHSVSSPRARPCVRCADSQMHAKPQSHAHVDSQSHAQLQSQLRAVSLPHAQLPSQLHADSQSHHTFLCPKACAHVAVPESGAETETEIGPEDIEPEPATRAPVIRAADSSHITRASRDMSAEAHVHAHGHAHRQSPGHGNGYGSGGHDQGLALGHSRSDRSAQQQQEPQHHSRVLLHDDDVLDNSGAALAQSNLLASAPGSSLDTANSRSSSAGVTREPSPQMSFEVLDLSFADRSSASTPQHQQSGDNNVKTSKSTTGRTCDARKNNARSARNSTAGTVTAGALGSDANRGQRNNSSTPDDDIRDDAADECEWRDADADAGSGSSKTCKKNSDHRSSHDRSSRQ